MGGWTSSKRSSIPSKQKWAELQDGMDELKEYSEITRDGVNTLISWADDVACVVKVPIKAAN